MEMDFSLWKSILLDWANSTGFLVQNYENLNDTDIDSFFQAFKLQIKSVSIESTDAIQFVKEYYSEFQLRYIKNEHDTKTGEIPVTEYVYIYSLFLHFSCVRYADQDMQNVCSSMLEKNQMVIAKFLESMIKSVNYTRVSIQDAIEEAENADSASFLSPLNKSIRAMLNKASPPTPRTKLLDSWNLDNRNLKAQLETERYERGYLEMQVKHCEEKLAKLDADYKRSLIENSELKKQINKFAEDIVTPRKNGKIDQMIRQLQKELHEKEEELAMCMLSMNETKTSNEFLTEKITYSEAQIQSLTDKMVKLYDQMDKMKYELDERDKLIEYVNGNNRELQDMVKELQSQSSGKQRELDSSYDLLNSSSSEMNNSSFSMVSPENLANAVVDVQLIDQQKQNLALSETVQQLQQELATIHIEANRLYTSIADSAPQISIESTKVHEIFPELMRLYTDIVGKNDEISVHLADSRSEITSLKEEKLKFERDLEASSMALNDSKCMMATLQAESESALREKAKLHEELQVTLGELETLNQLLSAIQAENSERKVFADSVKADLERTSAEKDEMQLRHSKELSEAKANYDAMTRKNEKLQSELMHCQTELSKANATLGTTTEEIQQLAVANKEYEKKLSAECIRFNAENEQMRTKYSEEIVTIKQLHDSAVIERDLLQLKLKEAEIELSKALNSQKEQANQVEQLSFIKAKLETELVTAEAKTISFHELTAKLAEFEEKWDKLHVELATLKELNQCLEQEIVTLSEEKSALEQLNVKLVRDATKAAEQIDLLKFSLSQQSEQLTSQATAFENLQIDYDLEQSKYSAVKKELDERHRELATIRMNNENLQKDVELNKSENHALNVKWQELTISAEQKSKEVTKVEEKLRLSEGKIDELSCAIVKLASAQEKLLADLKSSEETMQNKSNEIAILTAAIGKLTENEQTLKRENDLLAQSIVDAQVEHQELLKNCDALKDGLDDKQKQADDAKIVYERKLEELFAQEKELQSELSSLTKKFEATTERLATKQQDQHLAEITNIKASSEHKIEENVRQSDEIIMQLENEKKELKSKEADLCSQMQSISTQNTAFQQTIDELQAEKAKQECKIIELIEKLEVTTKTLHQAKTEQTERFEEYKQNAIEVENSLISQIEVMQEEKQKHQKEIAEATNKCNQIKKERLDLETKLTDELNQSNEKLAELLSEKTTLEEQLASAANNLELTTKQLQDVQAEIATIATEKNSLVTKVIELNRTIDEQMQFLTEKQEEFEREHKKISKELFAIRKEKQSWQEQLAKMKSEVTKSHEECEKLSKELQEISSKHGRNIHENKTLKTNLDNLQDENKLLINSAVNKEQVQALKTQINQLQKKYNESADEWRKEKETMMQDAKIYRAKLMKERETAEQKDKDYKAELTNTRHEYDEKLEKMKDRMKTLYKEEMSKVKEKHEKELNEHAIEIKRYSDKIVQFEDRFKGFSKQIYTSNEEKLMMLKEIEIMKSKLRAYEIGSTLHGNGNGAVIPPKFLDKIRGNNFKMEDEEGELFNNTYLDEMKTGNRVSPTGRDSISLGEIQRRNSMLPPHLRSSYIPQYQDQIDDGVGMKTKDEDFKSMDDSIFSTQSETRRGTLYKRPGPPTPSKHGGRASFGGIGAELPRGEILRELNFNAKEQPAIATNVTKSTAAKKSTPGKFRSIFSSAKVKDEDRASMFFSTSTPRRRSTKLSKFDSYNSFSLTENSVSTIDAKGICELHSPHLPHCQFPANRRISHKILCVNEKPTPSTDSTPDFESVKQNRVSVSRKSKKSWNRRRRSSMLAKQSFRSKMRHEQRIAAFTRSRKIASDDTGRQLCGLSKFMSTNDVTDHGMGNCVTYLVEEVNSQLEPSLPMSESEIDVVELENFHSEIIRSRSLEIIEDDPAKNSIDENVNFEALCNEKKSQHPYAEDVHVKEHKAALCSSQSEDAVTATRNHDVLNNLTPTSSNSLNLSSLNTTGTTAKASSHCARSCWNQHKIPQLHTYKAPKKIDKYSHNNNVSNGLQTSMVALIKLMPANLALGWANLPAFVKFYMIAATLCIISTLLQRLY